MLHESDELNSQIPATESLLAIISSVNEAKFNFQKQINNWIGQQEHSAIQEDASQPLDVRGLLLSNPKNMETELRFHKELFSKLKFNFLEQTTKETVLKRVLDQPTAQWCTTAEIEDAEKSIKNLKTNLKAYKKETENARDELAVLVDQVTNEHEELMKNNCVAEDVLRRLEPLESEIASLLQSFDPEKKTLSELMEINEKMREPALALQARLQTLESQIAATTQTNETLRTEITHLKAAEETLKVKISEAKESVRSRDPLLDEYLVWCQSWTSKLMQLTGIKSIEAVSTTKLKITFLEFLDANALQELVQVEPDAGKSAILELEIATHPGMFNQKYIIGKILNSKCSITDILTSSNKLLPHLGIPATIHQIVQETKTRLHLHMHRRIEKHRLERVDGLHVCWDDEAGLVEVGGLFGDGGKQERIVQVKIDGDYPRDCGCMEVVSVIGGKVEDVQDMIVAQNIRTVTRLFEALNQI